MMKGKITAALFLGAVLFYIPISADAEEVLTYREFLNAKNDTYVTVETYVQDKFVYDSDGIASLFAQSEEGAYYIYYAEMDEETYEALTPGLKIRVSGYKTKWSGETEIVDGEIEIIDDGDTFIAEPLDVSVYLGWEDMVWYQNSRVVCKDVRIESSIDPDGSCVPFLYAWDGTGREGDDLYFSGTCMGITYDFMVESDLCDANSETYQKVLGLETGDIVTLEGYLYYYENDPLIHVTEVTTTADDIKSAGAAADKAIEDSANEIEEEAGASGSSSSSRSSKSSGSSSSGSSRSSSGSSSSGSSRRSSSVGSSSSSDPYNAEDYDDPELFYDDNYLDFDSFEDAEVYWDDFQ